MLRHAHDVQGFGNHPPSTSPPASATFPDRYANNFEDVALNSEAPFLSDQAGKWEVRAEKSSSSKPNQVLSQVCVEQGVVYRASPLVCMKFLVITVTLLHDYSNLDWSLRRYVSLWLRNTRLELLSHWQVGIVGRFPSWARHCGRRCLSSYDSDWRTHKHRDLCWRSEPATRVGLLAAISNPTTAIKSVHLFLLVVCVWTSTYMHASD